MCRNCHKGFASPGGLRLHFQRNDTCRLTAAKGAFAVNGNLEGQGHEGHVLVSLEKASNMLINELDFHPFTEYFIAHNALLIKQYYKLFQYVMLFLQFE